LEGGREQDLEFEKVKCLGRRQSNPNGIRRERDKHLLAVRDTVALG